MCFLVCEDAGVSGNDGKPGLTDAQRARIERNRQRALLLQQSRIAKRPIEKDIAPL